LLIDIIRFDEKVGPGTFADWLTEFDCRVRFWRADRGELPPVEEMHPVILLGGYMGVNERNELPYLQQAAEWTATVVERGRPLLAICLGGQLLAYALGAEVQSQVRQEKGLTKIVLTAEGKIDPLFRGLTSPFLSFEWHNDSFELPTGSIHLAKTQICSPQVFRYRNAWGLQFHPEVDEQVVAEWCQRTGAGEGPLAAFRQRQGNYFQHSRQLLKNFIAY